MIPAAYAVIDLDAARHNLQAVRACAPNAKVMAVIKANGYGHGLVRVAEALRDADAFAVARVDEGVRLRKAGLWQRVAVLEGFTSAEELQEIVHYQLEAVIHSEIQLDMLAARAEIGQLTVWLKIDTGMNRLGFNPKQFALVYQRLSQCEAIRQPVNLMTHLANGDDKQDAMTLRQINLFNGTLEGVVVGERSIANSAGILGWPEALTDWVRPGVMLYGISPFPNVSAGQLGLKPIMSLRSRLISVKTVEKGETVGYGGSWVCPSQTTIGVAAIGYGDGYPRHARVGTPVLVNGKRVPLVGRVSMDMIMVDLGPEPDAKPGDAVVLWGNGLAVEEIAECAGTIPYTLVCGVTQRVRQIEANMLETIGCVKSN